MAWERKGGGSPNKLGHTGIEPHCSAFHLTVEYGAERKPAVSRIKKEIEGDTEMQEAAVPVTCNIMVVIITMIVMMNMYVGDNRRHCMITSNGKTEVSKSSFRASKQGRCRL